MLLPFIGQWNTLEWNENRFKFLNTAEVMCDSEPL